MRYELTSAGEYRRVGERDVRQTASDSLRRTSAEWRAALGDDIDGLLAWPGNGQRGIVYARSASNNQFELEALRYVRAYFDVIHVDCNYESWRSSCRQAIDACYTSWSSDHVQPDDEWRCERVLTGRAAGMIEFAVDPVYRNEPTCPWAERRYDVLFIARSNPSKNWMVVDDAARELSRAGLKTLIHVVGPPPSHPPSQSAASIYRYLHHEFVGDPRVQVEYSVEVPPAELARVMRSARTFLLVSAPRFEAGPRMLMDAAFLGTRPVVWDKTDTLLRQFTWWNELVAEFSDFASLPTVVAAQGPRPLPAALVEAVDRYHARFREDVERDFGRAYDWRDPALSSGRMLTQTRRIVSALGDALARLGDMREAQFFEWLALKITG